MISDYNNSSFALEIEMVCSKMQNLTTRFFSLGCNDFKAYRLNELISSQKNIIIIIARL